MKQDILGLRQKAYGWCKAFSGDISSCPAGGRQQCKHSFRGFGAEVSRASTLQGLSHVRQNLLEASSTISCARPIQMVLDTSSLSSLMSNGRSIDLEALKVTGVCLTKTTISRTSRSQIAHQNENSFLTAIADMPSPCSGL